MKRTIIALAAVLAAALLFTTCDWVPADETGKGYFDYEMQGTWETSYPLTPGYQGTLKIEYNTITIEGFSGSYVPTANRPFANFSRNTSLQAYSEKNTVQSPGLIAPAYEGMLYIATQGRWQQGIPVLYFREGGDYLSYKYYITLTFGTQPVTLMQVDD